METKVIPFRTMEGCVQIPENDPGTLVMCRECTNELCRKVQDNVRVLTTSHLTYADVVNSIR